MDEEEASPTDNTGLKRKLFTAASSNLRESFQATHALKALARRKISTNKSFDVIREQQKQNESIERYKKSSLSEGLALQAGRCVDPKSAFDGHALTVICPEYTAFSALAYLLDDALDEVSNLSSEKLPLISVELDQREGKIIIFDTSKGFEGVSVFNWGASSSQKLGSSGVRHVQNQDVNSIGYGVISAGLYLGGRIVVSSRANTSMSVATLQLSRSAWECAKTITVRKILSEARSATEEEENNSPHGSFRMVEISDLRPEAIEWNIEELRQKLKDLFFPYVLGNYASNGLATKPTTIMAMGLNLATIEGGQTTVMKSISSDREPFIVNLHLTDSAEESTGKATITFHYLPLTKGQESMDILQQRLNDDHLKIGGEAYKSERFSRVTVRWRGRLLMAENWKTISFLEGCKDLTPQQRQCYNRVIAFIDIDGGFVATPSKMSLAAEHCFTKSLKSCLLSLENDNTRVAVDASIQGQGWPLTPQILGLEYHNWIQDCNRKYDTDAFKDDQSVRVRQSCVTKPHNKLEMGITHAVFQVAWNMNIQGLELNSRDPQPIRLKLVKQNAPQLFFTLECFVCTGFQEASGATYIICRPIYVPKEQGSTIVDDPDPTFYLRGSKIFPLDESFRKKVLIVFIALK